MATGKIKVSVVDVGQGQCTFVEVYETGGALKHTLLFDCGSDKYRKRGLNKNFDYRGLNKNFDYIVSITKNKKPTFDAIFFSHSDKDHISQLSNLLKKYVQLNPTIKPTIDLVRYGGRIENYKKGKFNILEYLAKNGYCQKTNIKGFDINKTDYDKDHKIYARYMWESEDKKVNVPCIGVNFLTESPDNDDVPVAKTAEQKNHVSMICGLYFSGSSYVICGDATNGTMAAVNRLFKDNQGFFTQNEMLTLPHHGSRATGLAVKGGEKASENAIAVVKSFSKLMNAKSVTISSYQKNTHTSLELLSHFAPSDQDEMIKDPRLTRNNAHLLVLYNEKPKLKATAESYPIHYNNVSTTINVFGTDYFEPDYFLNKPISFTMRYGAFGKMSYIDPEIPNFVTPKPVINPYACWVYTTTTAETTLEGKVTLDADAFTEPATTHQQLSADAIIDIPHKISKPSPGSPGSAARCFSGQLQVFR